HSSTSQSGSIFEGAIAAVTKQGISHGVFAIECAHWFRRIFLETFLARDAFARGGPHVGDVKIFEAVTVIVEPADAHPCADVLDSRLPGNISKRSVAVVAVEILPAKVVDDI